MGYGVDIDIKDLVILAPNVARCLEAINALHEDSALIHQAEIIDVEAHRQRKSTRAVYAYGHVANPADGGFRTLVAAFHAWGYEAIETPDGSVAVYDYMGEKWGYDELLYKTIAPYVMPGAEIVVRGEEGALTRYRFEGAVVRVQRGTMTFEDA